ncbi:MAG: hypothetical protein CMN30_01600 [Sandaracinus sp.]|nr:hypothetical protein [Sandaracinus sp.]
MCLWMALAVTLACGDDDGSAMDAGTEADAGVDQGAPGWDAGVFPDIGPPPSGCDLLAGTDPVEPGDPAPAPDAFGALAGPGGPRTTFTEAERMVACASLDGGERDRDHHNTVLMLDGYLWMPWAHEGGVGGLSVFDFDDPCAPETVATTVEEEMRETHAAGVATVTGEDGVDRRYMVTTSLTGIMFWDVSDPTAPVMVHDMTLPDVVYPDSYTRVVMSTFWQAPYVYVGASDNGVFIVDASDPTAPELVDQVQPDPDFRVGGVHAIGTLLVILPSEGTRTALMDLSDPANPRRIPGGSFQLSDGTFDFAGRPRIVTAYFSHVNGDRIYYARHLLGGGLVTYDIDSPSEPRFLGFYDSDWRGANGGYVFVKGDRAFVGLSKIGEVIDISDPTTLTRMGRLEMTGDLDTLVPMGNVIVASVDDDAVPGEASRVYPWETELDTEGPRVNMVRPHDGTTGVTLGSRVGVTFDEPIDFASVFAGSFHLLELDAAGEPVGGPLPGHWSGQEGAVNFAPAAPLKPATRYRLVVPAGGVIDAVGNPTATPFSATFTTVACE